MLTLDQIDQLTDLFSRGGGRIFRGDPLDHVEPGFEHLLADVRQHVLRTGVGTRIAGLTEGFYDAEMHVIAAPPITDSASYWAWMHELGHVYTINGRDNRWDRLDAEADAWMWALDNALIVPTSGDWDYIRRSIRSYGDSWYDFGPPGESWERMLERLAYAS